MRQDSSQIRRHRSRRPVEAAAARPQSPSRRRRTMVSESSAVVGMLANIKSHVQACLKRQDDAYLHDIFEKFKEPCHEDSGIEDYLTRSNFDAIRKELKVCFAVDIQAEEIAKAGERSLTKAEFKEEMGKANKIEQWTALIPVHKLLAAALTALIEHHDGDPLPALVDCKHEQISLACEGILDSCRLLIEQHIRALREACEALDRAAAAVDESQADSMPSKFSVSTMSCGDVPDFFAGLGGRVGARFAPGAPHLAHSAAALRYPYDPSRPSRRPSGPQLPARDGRGTLQPCRQPGPICDPPGDKVHEFERFSEREGGREGGSE